VLAFAYIKPDAALAGTELEVIIAGKSRPAKVLSVPAYDPDNTLPRTDQA
ncbi:MAG: glycine cleavage T C-terminal barrel domain-containing protein, partial [Candidatus Puniceispirillales bacterium]